MKKALIILFAMLFAFAASAQTSFQGNVIDGLTVENSYAIRIYDNAGEKYMVYSGAFGHLAGYNIGVMLDRHRDIQYIAFDSTGGNLLEADAAGIRIRERGIGIWIPRGSLCASACAYLALYSQDIKIEGILAFHLPYSEGYSRETTLYQVSQSTVERTLRLTRSFFQNGFKAYLYLQIAQHSSQGRDIWLLIDSTEELNKFRFDDPSEFMDGVEGGGRYRTATTDELKQLLALQIDLEQ